MGVGPAVCLRSACHMEFWHRAEPQPAPRNFYQAGLKAAPDVPVRARNRRISSSSNGIDVEFLRSGKQFVVRDDGPVRPSGEGAKSANARLEDFFARPLAAAKVGSAPVRTPSAPRL